MILLGILLGLITAAAIYLFTIVVAPTLEAVMCGIIIATMCGTVVATYFIITFA